MDPLAPTPSADLRLLVVSGVRLYREGIAALLARVPALTVAGVAGDAGEAVAALAALRPDVVLLDTALDDAAAAVGAIREASTAARVVALAVAEEEEDVLAFAEAGVAGYVTRDASLDDLLDAVRGAARGELRCTPEMAGRLLRRLADLADARGPRPAAAHLTTRERQVLRLLDEDLSNKEIAVRLGIEVATVKNHVHNLLEKLNVSRRSEAARLLGSRRARPAAPPLPR